MIIVYIAHPIGGDIDGNLSDLRRVIKKINNEYPDVVPFCPYYADVVSMDDSNPTDRAKGISNGAAVIDATRIDELWLTGSNLSTGMKDEVEIANRKGIVVRNFIGII